MMKGKYYRPTGEVMMHVIDWLIMRSSVRKLWDDFLHDYALQQSDVVVEDGKMVEVKYYPPFIDDVTELDKRLKKLPKMPTYEALGALLGVERAKGITTVGSGTIVLVMDERGLKGHTELTAEELDKTYGIKFHEKDCPNCKLMMGHGEVRCQRCGEKV